MFRPGLAFALVISFQNATASMLVSRQKEAIRRKSGHSKPKISQYEAGLPGQAAVPLKNTGREGRWSLRLRSRFNTMATVKGEINSWPEVLVQVGFWEARRAAR